MCSYLKRRGRKKREKSDGFFSQVLSCWKAEEKRKKKVELKYKALVTVYVGTMTGKKQMVELILGNLH